VSLERLEAELELSKAIVFISKRWMPTLRKKLSGIVRETDALPSVCSFFALWSLHLMEGAVALVQAKLYSSSLLLLRSLIEAHIEISFILQRDCGKRAEEYLNASRQNRPPYREQAGFSGCETLGQRAGRSGMGELYRKTYLSLSYYSHLRVKGSLAFDPGSPKNLEEATACLIVGEAMLAKISKQLSRALSIPIPPDLTQKYARSLSRYKTLIRQQEETLAKSPAQNPVMPPLPTPTGKGQKRT